MTVGLEAVLRAQGMPSSARRRGRVAATAEWALREGLPYLMPSVAIRRLAIARVTHSRVHLVRGETLSGSLPAAQFAAAGELFVVAATVGSAIGNTIGHAAGEGISRALALEGVAIAGLESWVERVRADLQDVARARGWHLTALISPGMEGWPLESGQRELFALLGHAGPVRLLEGGMMWPRHSLSFVAGVGPGIPGAAGPCDWCGARAHCRHRPSPGR